MENIKNMTPKLIKELGMRFPTETSKQKATYGLYECQYCKKEFECIVQSISSGNTKSCGCFYIKHGLTSHRFYKTWMGMLHRCTNPKIKAYKNYGGRGITVCEEWLDIKNFIAWAESTHPNDGGYTLDRIDNDKGYNPENCRWADKTTQSVNKRISKRNTSGFVGINWHKGSNKWVARIKVNKVGINLGSFKDKIEAVQARDNYILVNKLPNHLSVLITK